MKNTKTILIAFLLGVLNISEAKSQLIISEFMHESNGADSLNEWIEIYNYSNDTVNLKDYYLKDYGTDSIIITTANYYLSPDSSIILAADKLTFEQNWLGGIPNTKVIDYDYNQFKMDDDFDEILLWGGVGTSIGYKNDGNAGISTFLDYNYEIDAKVFTWIYCDTCVRRLNRDSLDVVFGPDPIGYSDSLGLLDSLAFVSLNGDFGSPLLSRYKRNKPYITIGALSSFIEQNDTVLVPITLKQSNGDTSSFKFTLETNATATYGVDYLLNLNPIDTLVFIPGIDTFFLQIIILDDSIVEGVESFYGKIRGVKNTRDSNFMAHMSCTIEGNDTALYPQVSWVSSIHNYYEDTGFVKVGIVIDNSNSDSTGVILKEGFLNIEPINRLSFNDDFILTNTSLQDTIWFPPYFNDTMWLYANVVNDTVYESVSGYELNELKLISHFNGILLDNKSGFDSASTIILIDEETRLMVNVEVDSNSVSEDVGQVDFKFYMNQYCNDTLVFTYEVDTANSSASFGDDFMITSLKDSILFLPYKKDTVISVYIIDDTLLEPTEVITFKSNVTSPIYLYVNDNDSPSSIKEIKEEELSIKIYPNPAKDNVFVQIENENNKKVGIVLFDTFGKIVFKTESNAKSIHNNINVQDLSKGVYFIRVSYKDSIKTQKIIIN
jgi:hypothetical protein